jgi:NADH/F420H2 dehydrogenase subunit C
MYSKKFFALANLNSKLPFFYIKEDLEFQLIISVSRKNFFFLVRCLKDHICLRYNLLSCISGVDLLLFKYRFFISYDLLSLFYNNRIRVKVFVDEFEPITSVVSLYSCSNWFEREIWDMYGIYFENHPDLRRILSDYGFEGFPLRKDFPLSGYKEIKYDYVKKKIISRNVSLNKEYRFFNFESIW